MKNTKNYNHGSLINRAMQADAYLLNVPLAERETAYQFYRRLLSKYQIKTEDRGEKTK